MAFLGEGLGSFAAKVWDDFIHWVLEFEGRAQSLAL